jgi:hypothetical protein
MVLEPVLPVISSHNEVRPAGGELASSNLTLTFLTPSPVVRFATRPDIAHLAFAVDSAAKDLDVEQKCSTRNMVASTTVVRLIDIVYDSPVTPGVTKGSSTYAYR